MKRKLLAALLALVMVFSLMPITFAPKTAEAEDHDPDDDLVQETVQGGAILHCFDWSFEDIKANLGIIKEQGFTAVQTSPIQQPKDYKYNGVAGKTTADEWWKLYQPLGLNIAPYDDNGEATSWLGGVNELTSLCNAAHAMGIKVIVDIVANHLANKTGGGAFEQVNENIDHDLYNEQYFHTYSDFINDSSRFTITQYQMGMPDLNTGNALVQTKVLNLLMSCVDCGVDGFRFDAAKHIELDTDPENCRSSFWPTVINGIKNYCIENSKAEPFLYGEILGGAGTDIANYTQYMAVTDNETGNSARGAVVNHNASGLANYSYYKGSSPDKSVLWAESHDTWCDHSSDGVSDTDIAKTWAIVGARADSTSLFLARPGVETMGESGTDSWMGQVVREVNKFKNHFNGATEYLSDYGSVAYIERGVNGAVLVNLGSGSYVSVPAHRIKDGSYTDQISGNTFTVTNGMISGEMDVSGVAVIYNPLEEAELYSYISIPTVYLNPTDAWDKDGAWFAAYFFQQGTDNKTWVGMTSTGDGCYKADVPEGNWTNVIFVRMNGSETDLDWSSKWNQTVNLVPTSGTDCFTITSGSGDQYDGAWSRYVTSGYYLVGNMTGWGINQDYKLTVNSGNSTEFMIRLNLSTKSEFKIVKSTGGALTWYGDVNGNNYTVSENGSYTIYFNPNGNNDWGNDKYIWKVLEAPISEEDGGYYIVGTMNDWSVEEAYKLSRNTGNTEKEEYMIDGLSLATTDQFKVVYSIDGSEKTTWYPDPGSNYGQNGEIKQAGKYTIYFCPNGDGGNDWYFNVIYAAIPTFKTQSLYLEGKIGVNFYMDLSSLSDDEKSASYMTFAVSGKGAFKDTVGFDPNFKNNNGAGPYYGFTVYVASIQMADTITATFHYQKGTDERTVSKTYSVMDYFAGYDARKDSYTPAQQALIEATANFGYEVQHFLEQESSWSFGEGGYAEMTKSYPGIADTVGTLLDMFENHELAEFDKQASLYFEEARITYSLVLDSTTAINVYFTPTEDYTDNPTVTVTADESNVEASITKVGSRWRVQIPNIYAQDLDRIFEIKLMENEEELATATVSAVCYVRSMLAEAQKTGDDWTHNGTQEQWQKAAAAIYAYNEAADDILS